MEERNYICQYCKKEYIPKRRRVQKFCSNSCRVGSHQLKNRKLKNGLIKKGSNQISEKTKIDKMSIAGVGNAAVGSLAADAVKTIFTKEENKPLTKRDLKELFLKLDEIQKSIKNENDLTYRNSFFNT